MCVVTGIVVVICMRSGWSGVGRSAGGVIGGGGGTCVFIGIVVRLGVRNMRRGWSGVCGSAGGVGGGGGGSVELRVALLGGNVVVGRVVRPRGWPWVRTTRWVGLSVPRRGGTLGGWTRQRAVTWVGGGVVLVTGVRGIAGPVRGAVARAA